MLGALFSLPTDLMATVTASVTDTLADSGVIIFLGVVVAIPLLFYVAKRVIGLVPKGR